MEEEHLPDTVKEAMKDYAKPLVGLAAGVPGPAAAVPVPQTPSADELRALLELHKGHVAAVGRQLGKARMQIHRWMKRYGIEVDEYRS